MKIVFFAHPLFLGSQSMPRFVNMLAQGMESRGHEVEIWSPEAFFLNIPLKGLRKWLGYMDSYLVFPQQVRRKLKQQNNDVLYVVADNALGPYVPLISMLPHVIHCHDFLAQRSALGEIPENVTSVTGQKYQAFIRRGYSKGRNFISVSEKTRNDLAKFLNQRPERSDMVYNGLNAAFRPAPVDSTRVDLGKRFGFDLSNGFILHVGGNQWYKNRIGVVEIYDKWRKLFDVKLPLILIGEGPSPALIEKYNDSSYKHDIHFLSGIDDDTVRMAYASATVFLFPSIAEGFGWPIAEGMASGTIVITTNEAPMLEVAGDAAFLIDRKPFAEADHEKWTDAAAAVLQNTVTLTDTERSEAIAKGIENIKRFKLGDALDRIEEIYKQVLNHV